MLRKSVFLLFCFFVIGQLARAQWTQRPRVLVLTDIEADPDDTQSLIRFLLYSNQWDIEGLIVHHIHPSKKPGSAGEHYQDTECL